MDGDNKEADKKADAPQEAASWQYKPAAGATPDFANAPEAQPAPAARREELTVDWSASEFVAHEKGFGWYAALVLLSLLVSVGLYFATRDGFSVGVVVLMATILGVASARKPRIVEYRLDSAGLTAGKKFYPYSAYKSFSMPDDGPFTTIVLVPMKHLGFPTGAYLAPDSQDKALQILSSHLPLERGEPSLFDQIMAQLRF